MEAVTIVFLFLPLLLILWLANLAVVEREKSDRGGALAVVAYVLLVLYWGGFFFAGVILTILGWSLTGMTLPTEMVRTYEQMGVDPIVIEGVFTRLPQVGLSLALPALGGVALLLPFVRRGVARIVPIDASNPVHAVALSYTMLVVLNLWFTLAIGLDALAEMLAAAPQQDATALAGALWVQAIMFMIMAFVGVGWLARRDLGAVLRRLGLERPTGRHLLLGVSLGVAMVLLLLPLDFIGGVFDQNVERLTEQLVGPLTQSLFGVLTLGLAAGLGEEMLLRGALQPRFGLLFTSLIFALLHSNYGLSASTLIVFVVALALGWARMRHNTSTAIIAHATYNIVIGLASYLTLWP
ncbi:MAG: CPBP family intramembrane metalloprotease [Chloroflexi bacterium]|nr:CPBP family intramembrane metalloprotease [Chloroflexota bacterium]